MMDRDVTSAGVRDHRILHAFEFLATGFQQLGLDRQTAERLAEAHVIRLERDRFFARLQRGPTEPRSVNCNIQ